MGWGQWMAAPASLESQATLAIQRQQLQRMSAEEVLALADSLLVAFHDRDRLLRNAMKRLAELEVRQALIDHEAVARQLRSEQGGLRQYWAALRQRLRMADGIRRPKSRNQA